MGCYTIQLPVSVSRPPSALFSLPSPPAVISICYIYMITQKPPLSFFLAGLGGDLAGDLVTGFDGVFFVTPPLGATAFALGVAAFAARLAEGGLVGVTTAGLAGDFLAGVFFAGVFLAGVFLTGDLAGDLGAGLAGDLAGVLALEGVLPVLGVRALHLSDRSLLLRPLRGVENLGSLRILAQLPAGVGIGTVRMELFPLRDGYPLSGSVDRRAELAFTPPQSRASRSEIGTGTYWLRVPSHQPRALRTQR